VPATDKNGTLKGENASPGDGSRAKMGMLLVGWRGLEQNARGL